MPDRTVENRVVLPVPAAVVCPVLRIDVAVNAVCWRSVCSRRRRGNWVRGVGLRLRVGVGGGIGGRGPFGLGVCGISFPSHTCRAGQLLSALARSGDAAPLFLRRIEQIIGLVLRLGLRLFLMDERLVAGLGVWGIGFCDGVRLSCFLGSLARSGDAAQLFLRRVEQIVGLIR